MGRSEYFIIMTKSVLRSAYSNESSVVLCRCYVQCAHQPTISNLHVLKSVVEGIQMTSVTMPLMTINKVSVWVVVIVPVLEYDVQTVSEMLSDIRLEKLESEGRLR